MGKKAVLLGFWLGLAGSAQAGELQVCRPDYADKALNQKALTVPAGVVFEDWGAEKDDAVKALKSRWQLKLVTLMPLQLKAGQRCGAVAAAVTKDSQRRAVKPQDRRHFEPGGMLDGQGRDTAPYPPVWDWISQMTATVRSPIS
jgi:hypothetical protein